MRQEIERYAKRGNDFGFEATLALRSYLSLIHRLKKRGNKVQLFFVIVPTIDLELPLEQRAEMAFKAAVEEVIVEHARQGLPIYVWRDGRVVELSPKELQAESLRLQEE